MVKFLGHNTKFLCSQYISYILYNLIDGICKIIFYTIQTSDTLLYCTRYIGTSLSSLSCTKKTINYNITINMSAVKNISIQNEISKSYFDNNSVCACKNFVVCSSSYCDDSPLSKSNFLDDFRI